MHGYSIGTWFQIWFPILHTCTVFVHIAYSGRYCEEDRNGCSEVQCYVESSCHDIPAPGVGAECGPCPSGFTGDGNKCLGKYALFDEHSNWFPMHCMFSFPSTRSTSHASAH